MIPTAKTFFSCRLMRPDFRIEERGDGFVACWTEPEAGGYADTGDDRMELIERCFERIAEREARR